MGMSECGSDNRSRGRLRRSSWQTAGRWAGMLWLGACLTCAGCFLEGKEKPPQITVTPLVSTALRAKAPGCSMPILYEEPGVPYRQIAIVEGWGANDQRAQVLEGIEKHACQTGGDAVLILSKRSQTYLRKVYSTRGSSSENPPGQLGNAIPSKELVPGLGQLGHPGFYIDAVAIVYVHHHQPTASH